MDNQFEYKNSGVTPQEIHDFVFKSHMPAVGISACKGYDFYKNEREQDDKVPTPEGFIAFNVERTNRLKQSLQGMKNDKGSNFVNGPAFDFFSVHGVYTESSSSEEDESQNSEQNVDSLHKQVKRRLGNKILPNGNKRKPVKIKLDLSSEYSFLCVDIAERERPFLNTMLNLGADYNQETIVFINSKGIAFLLATQKEFIGYLGRSFRKGQVCKHLGKGWLQGASIDRNKIKEDMEKGKLEFLAFSQIMTDKDDPNDPNSFKGMVFKFGKTYGHDFFNELVNRQKDMAASTMTDIKYIVIEVDI